MKRLAVLVVFAALALQTAAPAFVPNAEAARRRVVVRKGPRRTTVVVHKGFPLRRRTRMVVVHPARVAVRVAPARYLSPVVFAGVVVAARERPRHDAFVWEDDETLTKSEGWTDFTLNCDARGGKLWLEVATGKVGADWAEVVFENGDTQVVDFKGKTHGPGLYTLVGFEDGREVDHIRMIARARSDETRLVLRMQK